MTDITTRYLGMKLKNPLVASSSPLCQDLEKIEQMEEAGLSAVVLHSLFEEQINIESEELNRYLVQGTERFAESLTYFPEMGSYNIGPEEYLDHLSEARDAVEIPVIASLNGVSTGGWVEYAEKMEEAGADALELNAYYIPTDTGMAGNEVEKLYVQLVSEIKSRIAIPVALKLSPYFSSIPNMAWRLGSKEGVDGLVLFNRFYQPDLDVENLEVTPNLVLSTSRELRLRVRWVAILFENIEADMAITGGVHTGRDVVKAIMAGADVAMMTSALLKNGIKHAKVVLESFVDWMEEHGYQSVQDMRGVLSQRAVAEPTAFERANYMKVLHSYEPPR